MSENVSRRKMLSLLGVGAALGLTLSAALEPLEAEAQEAAPAVPTPLHPLPAPPRPLGHMGCNDGKDGAAIAVSGAQPPSATAYAPHR